VVEFDLFPTKAFHIVNVQGWKKDRQNLQLIA